MGLFAAEIIEDIRDNSNRVNSLQQPDHSNPGQLILPSFQLLQHSLFPGHFLSQFLHSQVHHQGFVWQIINLCVWLEYCEFHQLLSFSTPFFIVPVYTPVHRLFSCLIIHLHFSNDLNELSKISVRNFWLNPVFLRVNMNLSVCFFFVPYHQANLCVS